MLAWWSSYAGRSSIRSTVPAKRRGMLRLPIRVWGDVGDMQSIFQGQGGNLLGGDGGAGSPVQGAEADKTAEPSGDLPQHPGADKSQPGGLVCVEQPAGQVRVGGQGRRGSLPCRGGKSQWGPPPGR